MRKFMSNLMQGGGAGGAAGGTKEDAPLEGKTVEVGQMKVQVKHCIAEGGFSCVYAAREAATGRQFAMKHIICNDGESLDLVRKEVAVMKALRGHPNVVTLHAQTLYDLGRTKECFLVMDLCTKSLVAALDARGGAGFFDERQILLIFRDVCNAVYAMHSHSPPIAHRDLKAENVLLSSNGAWKLCDFGSTSTNHKRFERPEEMGVEEDIIRKHTTPAYRAPEMWDLYRRELINEKVDIWALGCLLYRIAYLKSAFDGESKLQILNGNYRIPELPKYSSSLVELIRDMLKGSPEERPDILQIWHCVNNLLPADLRKSEPDGPSVAGLSSEAPNHHVDPRDHGLSASFRRNGPAPSRPAPSPPVLKETDGRSPPRIQADAKTESNANAGSPLGAFWATQYAQEAVKFDEGPVFDKDPMNENSLKHDSYGFDAFQKQDATSPKNYHSKSASSSSRKNATFSPMKYTHVTAQSLSKPKTEDINSDRHRNKLHFEESRLGGQTDSKTFSVNTSGSESAALSSDDTFNTFVADFDNSKFNVSGIDSKQEEIDRLRDELAQLRLEKEEITSKYEKLTAICCSQRQEIHDLKQMLAGSSKATISPPIQEKQSKQRVAAGNWQANNEHEDKKDGATWDLQDGIVSKKTADADVWKPFPGSFTPPKSSPFERNNAGDASSGGHGSFDSLTPSNGHPRQQQGSSSMGGSNDSWGFPQESFIAQPSYRSSEQSSTFGEIKGASSNDAFNKKSQGRISQPVTSSQPAGWAGF